MRTLFICCFLSFVSRPCAQSFPQSFVGHWEGDLSWYQTGKKDSRKVKMQLIVRPADTAGQYTWQIIYGERNQDNRPYLLKPVDTAAGHWVVDERNGIVLDQYFLGGRFTGAFTVQTSTIVASYWMEKRKMHVEFHSVSATPINTSGGSSSEIPQVASYSVKSYQKAILKKKR